jgi:hypothetical protein
MRQRTHAPALAQLVDLFLIEVTNWRWCWRSMLITGTLAPVFSILAMEGFCAGFRARGAELCPNRQHGHLADVWQRTQRTEPLYFYAL